MKPLARVFSQEFSALSAQLASYITEKKVGCITGLVYHKDKVVYCEKFGWKELDKVTIEFDSIYRIMSMTKPIISVAALILYERGKFKLDDPEKTP